MQRAARVTDERAEPLPVATTIASPALRRTSTRVAVAIAVGGAIVLILAGLLPPAQILSRPNRGDVEEYYHYTQRTFDGQVPYRDFVLEYPPGALPVLLAAAPADSGYFNRFRLLMLGLGVAAMGLLVTAMFLAGGGPVELASGALLLATLPLTLEEGLVFERYDLWPTALVLLSAVALLRGHRTLGLASLGLGAAAKLYPLALVPIAILARRGRAHVRRDLAVVAVAGLALALPFAVLAPRGLGHVGWLLVRRPLHVESLGGSVLLVAHRFGAYHPTIYLSIGQSWDLAGPAAKLVAVVSALLEAAALVTVWILFSRGRRGPRDLLLAFAATVVGFVAFGKILSPQYLIWVAAAVPLALGRIRPYAFALALGAILLTRYVYVYGYDDLLRAGPVSWVMLARNGLLVALFCLLAAELAARTRSSPVSDS